MSKPTRPRKRHFYHVCVPIVTAVSADGLTLQMKSRTSDHEASDSPVLHMSWWALRALVEALRAANASRIRDLHREEAWHRRLFDPPQEAK